MKSIDKSNTHWFLSFTGTSCSSIVQVVCHFQRGNQNYPLTSSTVYSPPPSLYPEPPSPDRSSRSASPTAAVTGNARLWVPAQLRWLSLFCWRTSSVSVLSIRLYVSLSLPLPLPRSVHIWLLSCWLGSYGISRTHTVKNSIREMNIYERGMRENERWKSKYPTRAVQRLMVLKFC